MLSAIKFSTAVFEAISVASQSGSTQIQATTQLTKNDEFTHPRLTQQIEIAEDDESAEFAEDIEPESEGEGADEIFIDEEPKETIEEGNSEDFMESEEAYDSCYYDPYGYNCGRQEALTVYYEPYSKGDVHTMVWTSLLQVAYPITIFIVREAKVWEDLMGKNVENSDWTRDHYTDEIKAWEQILVGHSLVWGPMFILGILGLSEVLEVANSRLIEHWVSNLHIPMYIYGTVKLLTVATDSGAAYDWIIFGVYVLLSIVNGAIQMLNGTDAQYFLIDSKSKWADQVLYPSLFYLINWIDHSPRYFENDYYGGYGYGQPEPYYYED